MVFSVNLDSRSHPRARIWPGDVAGMAKSLTLRFDALNYYQVYRLRWKVALIDEIDEKLSREPLVLPNRIKSVLPQAHPRVPHSKY